MSRMDRWASIVMRSLWRRGYMETEWWGRSRVWDLSSCRTRMIITMCGTEINYPPPPPPPPLSAAYMRQWIGSALVQIWLAAYSAPSHYLNQCWVIVNWTRRNKIQWNSNQSKSLSFMEIHLKMLSAKRRPISQFRHKWSNVRGIHSDQWFSLTVSNNVVIRYFLCCQLEQAVEQAAQLPVESKFDIQMPSYQGNNWQSGRMPYRKISRSLEATRFGLRRFRSLWNLTGFPAALPISQLRDVARFGG